MPQGQFYSFFSLDKSRRYSNPSEKTQVARHSEEEDLESEVTLLEPSHHPQSRSPRPFVNVVTIVISFCLGVLAANIAVYVLPRHHLVRGLDVKTPIPDAVFAPRVKVPYVPDSRYYGSGENVDKEWRKLAGGGDAIWLENPSAYGLAKGIADPFDKQSPDERFYVLSNLHQVHCLNVVRMRFRQYESRQGLPVNESEAVIADWKEHTDHCIEYLRLSVMCGDFMVLEPDSPPDTPAELTAGGLGWGVVHDCIDFEALTKWQAEQRSVYEQKVVQE